MNETDELLQDLPNQLTALVAARDWSQSPLGPIGRWSKSLRTAVDICLNSPFPMAVAWGSDLITLYNDAYATLLGHRHPNALGQASGDVWPELWKHISTSINSVLSLGRRISDQRVRLTIERHGLQSEIGLTWSHSPILDDTGKIGGIFSTCREETDLVLIEQERDRLTTLWRDVSAKAEQRADVFDKTLTHINDFAYIFDRDGRFLFANRPLLALWGIELEQAVGKNFFDLQYPPELAARLQRQIQQVIDTKREVIDETLYTSPSGVAGYYEYIFTPIFTPDGQVNTVAGSTREITRRKRLEMEREQLVRTLDAERANLAAVIEKAPAFIVTLRGPDHVVQLANDGYYSLIGRRDIVGKSIRNALPDIEGQGFFELLDHVYKTGEPFIGNELPVVLSPGGPSQLHFVNFSYQALRDADGAISGVFVHGVDVTNFVRSRDAIEEIEQQRRLALDSAELGAWHIDFATLELTSDARFRAIFGTTEKQISYDQAFASIHPDDRERVRAAVEASMHPDNPIPYAAEYRVIHPDGSIRWVFGKGRANFTGAGESKSSISLDGTIIDITERKRADDDQLRMAEQRQLALDAARMGWWHYDPATQIATFDQRYTEIFGIVGHQKPNEEILNRIHPEDRAGVWASAEAALNPADPKSFAVNYRVVHDDGSIHWVQAYGLATFEGSGDRRRAISFVGTVADITDERQSTDALRQSEAEFRLLADAMPQIVWSATPDGVLDYYNRRWFEFIDLSPTAGKEADWARFVHTDDLPRVGAAWADCLKSGDPYSMEFRVRGGDGVFRWFLVRALPIRNEQGDILRWLGTCTDIHDQRIAVDALREGRLQMDVAVAAGKMGTWQLDLATMEMTCSDTCKKNYGRPSDQPFTYPILWDCLHPADHDTLRAGVQRAIEQGGELAVEYRVIWPNGSVHWVAVRGRISYADDGKPIRLSGVSQNITERKHLEADREQVLAAERAARSEAELAGRMKDEFLATLSHEIRTPLNAILGWARIMRKSGDPKDVVRGMEIIERNARAQSQIIEDLLDMSRIISGKVRLDVQRLDLAAIVQSAVETARPTAEAKGVRLISVIDPLQGVTISGDANRLQQILWNLISNAIKFTPRDGHVRVLLERVNSHLEISVIDSGEGIKLEFLAFVFDRFRQADASTTRRHGGLGLGLSITKQLVELHGGSLRVKSAGEGLGATFIVTLPLLVTSAEQRPESERRHPRIQHEPGDLPSSCDEVAGVRVLVIDDEPDARSLVKRLLEDYQAVVTVTDSVDEAVNLVRSGQFDVLVSDIGMPGEDGYSLIRRVRQLGKNHSGDIPAIALTAYARTEDRVKAIVAGFLMHVSKPVEPMELVMMVASAAKRIGMGEDIPSAPNPPPC